MENIVKKTVTTHHLLSTRLNCLSFQEILNSIETAMKESRQLTIFYASIYSINLAKKNQKFNKIINSADIIFPDGTGVWLGNKFINRASRINRFNFSDHAFGFWAEAIINEWKVYLLGSEQAIIDKARRNLSGLYKIDNICGMSNGYDAIESKELISKINSSSPDILLVGMGTPKQEEWIYNNKEKLDCKVIISVGDLFRIYAGERVRGPLFIRRLGLEWLIRLVMNPNKYFKRYVFGIPEFCYNLVRTKKNKDPL